MDPFCRVSPAVKVRCRDTGYDGVRTLERAPLEYGVPHTIRVDDAPGFVSKEVDLWAYANGVTLECLNQHRFLSLEDVRIRIDQWREMYNHERPHRQLEYKTPVELAEAHRNEEEKQNNLSQNFA